MTVKYMTFNSSCSYAGVANLLELHGFDTDDRTIALEMKLPCLFAYEDGAFLAGPMLQSAAWFNLYLHPNGYHMQETHLPRDMVFSWLQEHAPAMLGLEMENRSRHAVICLGKKDGKLRFLNNKWQHGPSPAEFDLTESELLARLDDSTVAAAIHPIAPIPSDLEAQIRNSPPVIRRNLDQICAICREEHTVSYLRSQLNTLFRPLLLDAITMLNLQGETAIAMELEQVQSAFLAALRQDPSISIRLGDFLPMDRLNNAAERFLNFINLQIETG